MSEAWWYFWAIAFVVAGSSFAFIAAIVLVRGIGDLRTMIRLLELERNAGPAGGGNRITDDR